jgi:hypothetical protein
MNSLLPSGPCLCGASDCASCGPAQGYTILDSDALEGFIQSEIAHMRRSLVLVDEALGSLSEEQYATNARLVFEAIAGERDSGFRPAQLQAIGEHLVTAVLMYFDKRARAL